MSFAPASLLLATRRVVEQTIESWRHDGALDLPRGSEITMIRWKIIRTPDLDTDLIQNAIKRVNITNIIRRRIPSIHFAAGWNRDWQLRPFPLVLFLGYPIPAAETVTDPSDVFPPAMRTIPVGSSCAV